MPNHGGKRAGAGSGGPRPGAGRPPARVSVRRGQTVLVQLTAPDGTPTALEADEYGPRLFTSGVVTDLRRNRITITLSGGSTVTVDI
jgi:hypothetical protein